MIRKIVAAAASTALSFASFTPALAQNYRFAGADAPLGATATANLRIPLGVERSEATPNYGLTLGFGRTAGSQMLGGRTTSRAVTLADLRFTDAGLQKAEVASFNLADPGKDRRLNMMGGSSGTLAAVGVVAIVVGVCIIAECFDEDDDDNDDDD
jgi:hypothetical protein